MAGRRKNKPTAPNPDDNPDPRTTSTPTETDIQTTPSSSPLATPQATSSSPEPFLRFPRPQVNSDLARWISDSDPDIMHRRDAASDESGLSDSAYELVQQDADNESQDEIYNGSMTESIGSLDLHGHMDDVQSFAGTERTVDTGSVVDDAEASQVHLQEASLQTLHTNASEGTLSQSRAIAGDTLDEDPTAHASLQYTQQSLKTPSMVTPDISMILPDKPKPLKIRVREAVQQGLVWTFHHRSWTAPLLCVLVLTLFSNMLPLTRVVPVGSDNLKMVTPAGSTPSETCTSTWTAKSLATASSSSGTALMTVENKLLPGPESADALHLALSTRRSGELHVAIPKFARDAWAKKNCLYVGASRDGERVDVSGSYSAGGITIQVPKQDARGLLELTLHARCEPRLLKTLRVHLGKDMYEEAMEKTRLIMEDMKKVLPAAAQEAERGYILAKQSIETMSQHWTWPSTPSTWYESIMMAAIPVADWMGNTQREVTEAAAPHLQHLGSQVRTLAEQMQEGAKLGFSATQQVIRDGVPQARLQAQHVSDKAQLGLVQAQITAKLWWLKTTASAEEHDTYRGKARGYLTALKEQLRGEAVAREMESREEDDGRGSAWGLKKIPQLPDRGQLRQGFCHEMKRRGYSFPKQCRRQV